MNVYLISQSTNNDYDTFDSAVVIAPDEATAKTIHPSNWSDTISYIPPADEKRVWDWVSDPDLVAVELIGTTDSEDIRIVCASYNAG